MSRRRTWWALAAVIALGLTEAVQASADLPLAPGVVALPSSIDATGARDVAPELNAFFRDLPDGATVEFPANGTFRIETPVTLQDKVGVTVDGNGSRTITTTRGDRTRQHWRLVRGSGIVIRDLTVKGANPNAGTSEAAYVASLEAQHGFNIAGTHGVILDHVTVTDVYGDFVYLGTDAKTKTWSEDVTVTQSNFNRNGRQGIALTGARRVLIDGNTIENTRRATFDLEPNGGSTGVEDVVISNNRIGSGRLNFLSSQGSGPVNKVTVRGNQLRGRAMNSAIGVGRERRHGWTISDNVADTPYGSPGGAVIVLRSLDGVAVTGNTQPLQRGRSMAGVAMAGVCGAVIAQNSFTESVTASRVTAPCPVTART